MVFTPCGFEALYIHVTASCLLVAFHFSVLGANTGLIVGVTSGAVALLVILCGVMWWRRRQKVHKTGVPTVRVARMDVRLLMQCRCGCS